MKLFIQNRKNQKVCVSVEKADTQKGLAFVMHGLSGNKDQPHIETFARAFKDNDFTVIRFDTTNTFGESDGTFEDATTTNYYEDLEDVIAWAETQDFYEEPFFLAGHSLGGISTIMYAERYPEKVEALAPISSVISGNLSIQTKMYSKEVLEEWKRTGWLIKPSGARSGIVKKIKWAEMEDRLTHDVIPQASKLTMPVLLIVGSEDENTPLEHQEIFYNALPGHNKELHVIEGAAHTFRDEAHLSETYKLFDVWIKKVKNS